jgi:C-terminal processing protease CtpA/Prc
VSKFAVAVCIALLAGLAVGSWLATHRPEAETAQVADTRSLETNIDERVRQLEKTLLEEREARVALGDTLAALLDELDTLGVAEQRAAAEQDSRQARQQTAQQEARRRDRANWAQDYNERRVARMVEGGFTEEEARDLLDKESAASYEAMRAAWEAERNGAALDPFAEQSDPQHILRDSIGDDAYERYLRSQGQPTSVEVTQVLSGSPGAGVGLVTGDRIARYNGERVFSISDLRRLTMQGNRGEDVVIEVMRDGVLMQLTLPAGPIGITGTGARVRGMNWWGG